MDEAYNANHKGGEEKVKIGEVMHWKFPVGAYDRDYKGGRQGKRN